MRHDQRLAFDVVEADVEVVRDAALEVAVDEDLLDVLQAVQQAFAQRLDAGQLGGHLFAGDAEGLAHADDLVGGQGARTHAALVAAAVHLRFDADARLAAHVQRADALRAVGLVRRTRTSGRPSACPGRSRPCRWTARRRRGRGCPSRGTARRWLGDVLDHADLVVHVHDRDQDGVGAQRRLEHVQDRSGRLRSAPGRSLRSLRAPAGGRCRARPCARSSR